MTDAVFDFHCEMIPLENWNIRRLIMFKLFFILLAGLAVVGSTSSMLGVIMDNLGSYRDATVALVIIMIIAPWLMRQFD